MQAELTLIANRPEDVPALAAVLAALQGHWPNTGSPAVQAAAAAPTPSQGAGAPLAPPPAPSALQALADGGETTGTAPAPAAGADDTGGPMRGKNAETHAKAIMDRLSAVETLGGLEDVLADAAPTMARLPEKWRAEINTLANSLKLKLEAPAASSADPAENAAKLEALTGEPAPAAPEFTVLAADGSRLDGFQASDEAYERFRKLLAEEAKDPSEVQTLLQVNDAGLKRLGAERYNTLRQFAAQRATALLLGGDAPAAGAEEKTYTEADCRAALEECLVKTSFEEANARMQGMGYAKLSDIPNTNASRAAFIRTMRDGL